MTDRPELTWMIDLTTRTIPAAVLRPSAKSVDAALLLASIGGPLASGIGGLDNAGERSSPALPGQSYLDLEVLPCALAAWAFGTHRGS
jgi:putative transposase